MGVEIKRLVENKMAPEKKIVSKKSDVNEYEKREKNWQQKKQLLNFVVSPHYYSKKENMRIGLT